MNIRLAVIRGFVAGALATGCGGGPTTPRPSDQSVTEIPARLPPLTPLGAAVKQAYEQIFNEPVFRPAVFESNFDVPFCSRYVTSTAFLGPSGRQSTLLTLNMSSDGTSVTKNSRVSVLTPAGSFRVLTAVVGHPETIGPDSISLLEGAQRLINDDHASFAASRGYGSPIVTFTNTNVRVEPSEGFEPRSLTDVLEALSRQGQSVSGYDFLVSLNVNPLRAEGGFAVPGTVPAFIYMGNISLWKVPLSAANMNALVGAVYHHEVLHHWGWPSTHDWGCANTTYEFNFRVKPILLGWEDLDGDRAPEIVDPTPYGRSRR